MTVIPTELIETILDFLHDDRLSLYSSSLVSRSWIPTTRYHIFNRLTLSHLLTNDGPGFKDNVTSFFPLVKSPHCTILPAVHTAVLEIDLGHKKEYLEDVISILTSCRALVTLEYLDPTFLHDVPRSISWIPGFLPDIRNFTFAAWRIFPDDVYRLSASFKELRALSLYARRRPVFSSLHFPSDVSGANFQHLRTLRLGTERLLEPFMRLRHGGWQPQLDTFDIRLSGSSHTGWGRVTTLNSFLTESQSTLSHLSLSREYDKDIVDTTKEKVDLSSLSSLRSISLKTHAVADICDLLLTVANPSSSLESIIIETMIWHGTDSDNDEELCHCVPSLLLKRLAGVMERRQLCGIKVLDIRIPLNLGDEALDLVGRYFESWRMRNALKLGFSLENST